MFHREGVQFGLTRDVVFASVQVGELRQPEDDPRHGHVVVVRNVQFSKLGDVLEFLR